MADKRTLKHLEQLFIAEIEGRDVQLHKKTADRLERLGLIARDVGAERSGPFTFTTEFHRLTHAGRFAYCASCEDGADDEIGQRMAADAQKEKPHG